MILIISDKYDQSTTTVIEWLDNLKKKWIRLNEDDVVEIDFLGKEIQLINKEKSVLLSDIQSVWYRRGFLNIKWDTLLNDANIKRVHLNERKKIIDFIYYLLRKKKNVNDLFHSDVNKLIVTDIASSLGLSTTNDYIFSDKDNLLKVTEKSNTKYISKPISGDSMMAYEEFTIFNYTTFIDNDKIETTTFFPSLVQNYIVKKYELRVFYFHGLFFSMAIFSQNDNQTTVDFRDYNNSKPNRTVPFKLHEVLEEKLTLLMKSLGLNSGSIDMIVTPENDFVFLEVNPIGQFGMVSYPCNYNLEKVIANYL